MHGFWKRKLPAFLLALVLVTSLIPAAAAADCSGGEHDWSPWTTTIEADCNKVGTEVRTCSKCNTPETRSVPATGVHDYEVISNTATCGKDGELTRKCKVCGVESKEISPATGSHTWQNTGSPNPAPTCTSTGTQLQTCSVCKETQNQSIPTLGHSVNSTTGKCTRCGMQVNPIPANITVTFMNGSAVFATRSVTSGSAPSNPGTPSYPSVPSGCTYTFKGWTTTNPGSKAIYTNQSLTNVASVGVSGNTTYYAVYTLTATSQNVTVSAGNSNGTVIGSSIVNELNSRFSSLAGQNSFNSVSFGSSNGRGTLYANSNRNGLSYNYSYSPSAVSSFYFVPGSSNGYTITYTAVDNWSNKISGTITVNNSNTAANGTITYYVAPGGTVDFKSVNFADAYRNLSGDTSTLRWVSFSAPNRYGDLGYLYSGSLTLDRSRLINNDYYYSSSSYGQYALSSLNFKAASNARNGDTVSIPFRAYYNNSTYYDGTVKIVISQNGGDGVVTYRVAPGQSIRFDRTPRRFQLSHFCWSS